MKTLFKILLGLVLLIAAAVGAAFWATSGLPDAADRFFSRIAAGDYAGAIALTTSDFQAQTDAVGLETLARGNGMDGYRSARWSTRSIENHLGRLEGTLMLADGSTMLIALQLVKSDGEWLVHGLRKSPAVAGVADSASAAPLLPSAHLQQQLVAGTLRSFVRAVSSGDFSMLHADASARFQKQVAVEQLAAAFDDFSAQQDELRSLLAQEPQIAANSGLQSNGALRLAGQLVLDTSALLFDLYYIPEAGTWRLIEIDVRLR